MGFRHPNPFPVERLGVVTDYFNDVVVTVIMYVHMEEHMVHGNWGGCHKREYVIPFGIVRKKIL